jgi:hypothetical protein
VRNVKFGCSTFQLSVLCQLFAPAIRTTTSDMAVEILSAAQNDARLKILNIIADGGDLNQNLVSGGIVELLARLSA